MTRADSFFFLFNILNESFLQQQFIIRDFYKIVQSINLFVQELINFWINKNNLLSMMERAKSFSKIGLNLDVNLHTATKPKEKEELQKVLKSKSSITLKHNKGSKASERKKKQQISHSLPRQTLNSFQKCHTKVQNINAIYNQKIEITKKSNQHFSMKKYNPRSYFDTISECYEKQHVQTDPCDKLVKTMRSQKWLQAQQTNASKFNTLNSTSRSKLLIPFEKQTERPFYKKLQKLQQQACLKPLPTDEIDVRRQQLQRKQRARKTHSFSSYSQHDLLNPQKIPKLTSAMNIHEIDPKKYKMKNMAANLKFDRFVNKILTRYDRDCEPWISKLQYEPKESLVRRSYQTRNFHYQTERKLNEVHSKYPIRLAM